jgi:hypothetical protein
MDADPNETRDLASHQEQAARVRDMLDRLVKLQTIYDDKLPLTSEHPQPAAAELPPKRAGTKK